MTHKAFTLRNPNRARSLVSTFCAGNAVGFHAPDGSGYGFWAEQVIALDALNPQVASRLARAMDRWRRFTPDLQARMKRALQQVAGQAKLSNDVREVEVHETSQPDAIPRRGTASPQQHPGIAAPPDRSRGACLQDHLALGRQGRAGRHPRQREHGEHPGRSAEEARRDLQRDPARGQRMGRPPGGDGVGRDGIHPPDPEPLPDGRIHAAVRPAGRLVEHRRQRFDRHHLLRAEGARRHDVAHRSRLHATGQPAGRGRLCRLRPADDAGADDGRRRQLLHAGPRNGFLGAHAEEHADSGRDEGIRHQHVEPAPLVSAGHALRRRNVGRQDRSARQGFQHALDRVDGGRRAPHPEPRRHLHVPGRPARPVAAGQAAPDVRSEPDGVHRRAGGRRRDGRPPAHPRHRPAETAPARARVPGLEERGGTGHELPPGIIF
ncbi:hypothetical protein Lal_00014804 [Lupinus albus]|nr:hypothetical protein Lal_00014804 [Lupinus albus]